MKPYQKPLMTLLNSNYLKDQLNSFRTQGTPTNGGEPVDPPPVSINGDFCPGLTACTSCDPNVRIDRFSFEVLETGTNLTIDVTPDGLNGQVRLYGQGSACADQDGFGTGGGGPIVSCRNIGDPPDSPTNLPAGFYTVQIWDVPNTPQSYTLTIDADRPIGTIQACDAGDTCEEFPGGC